MNFWALNKQKVLRVFFLAFIGLFLFLIIIVRKSKEINSIIISSFFASLWITAMDVWGGLIFFRAVRRIIKDTSETSIAPLFDNGYSIELQNETKLISYTTPRFKISISGIPTTITFWQDTRGPFSNLTFEFHVSNNNLGIDTKTKVFQMRLMRRIQKDIKPDILKFISDDVRAIHN